VVSVPAAAKVAQDLTDPSVRVDGDDDVRSRRFTRSALIVDALSGAMGARRSFGHRTEV